MEANNRESLDRDKDRKSQQQCCDNTQKLTKQSMLLSTLPESFLQFLKSRGISREHFLITPPRYFRLKPSAVISLEQIADDLAIPLTKVCKMNDFYRLPAEQSIHHSKLYTEGLLYGMDMSSGYAVKALGLEDNLHVLELCCAPGNKLMYIRDLMKGGSVTGVDISQPRMEVTRSLIKKYGHEHTIKLYCEDATTFKTLNQSEERYDRVLVDAECTHEGSLKHLKKFLNSSAKKELPGQKLSRKVRKQFVKNNSNPYTSEINTRNEWTKDDFEERFLDKKKLQVLHQLQTSLIENGYNLLKPGGFLVYSTCSFDKSQNEAIIQEFLIRHPNCQLIEPFPEETNVKWQKSDLKYAIRFTPQTSCTGGLFIAKLQRKQ